METIPTKLEKKPKYKLNIIVHRHGPKQGEDGPLSEEGKQVTRDYFENAYEGVSMDSSSGGIDIVHSPINRTQQTASIYSQVVEQTNSGVIKSEAADDRLSEGGIAENKEVLGKLLQEYGAGGKWIIGWLKMEYRPSPEIKSGQEAVADFSKWILDKVSDSSRKGGSQEIDAFSHGPVMAAFLLKLQEKLGLSILPENWQEKKIFENVLNYLSSMNLWTDSDMAGTIQLNFAGNKIEVPIKALNELVEENKPYMGEMLRDVADENVDKWISEENLRNKNKRMFQGFEIFDAIDGNIADSREVSLVKITSVGTYPKHVHRESDAYFIITKGEALLLKDNEEIPIKYQDRIKVPRGMVHGFKLNQGQSLEFIVVQSPPIRNRKTGEEDFHLTDHI